MDQIIFNETKESKIQVFSKFQVEFCILLLILITDNLIIIPVPIVSEIFFLIFLLIIPGWLIVRLLKIQNLDTPQFFLLIIGISLAFQMLFGLLLNFAFPFFGYKTPLSQISLLSSLNIIYFLLLIASAIVLKEHKVKKIFLNLNNYEKVGLVSSIFIYTLIVFGSYFFSYSGINTILSLSIFCYLPLILFIFYKRDQFSDLSLSLILISISMSLLFILPAKLDYILGFDINSEYLFFQKTFMNLHWEIDTTNRIGAVSSSTLLPTIFASLMNITSIKFYTFFFPALYSLTPVIAYYIIRNYFNSFSSFLISLFFMFNYAFLMIPTIARTSIAFLFVAFLILIILNITMSKNQKIVLSILFFSSVVISAYSTGTIVLAILIISFLVYTIINKIIYYKNNDYIPINIITISIFCLITFLWFYFLFYQIFLANISLILDKYSLISSFDLSATASSTVMTDKEIFILNFNGIFINGIWNRLLISGFFFSIVNFVYFNNEEKFPLFQERRINLFFLVLSWNMTCLYLFILFFPKLFVEITWDRFTPLILLTTSFLPLLGISGLVCMVKKLVEYSRRKTSFSFRNLVKANICEKNPRLAFLVLIILGFSMLLFSCGVVNDIFGIHQSLFINSPSQNPDIFYRNNWIFEQEAFSAKFLQNFVDTKNTNIIITSDSYGIRKLESLLHRTEVLNSKDLTRLGPGEMEHAYIFSDRHMNATKILNLRYFPIVFRKNLIYDNEESNIIY
jgi:uncharacterized membrane protein